MDKYCSKTANLRKFEELKFKLSLIFGIKDSFLASPMSHYFISSSSLLIIHFIVYYRLVCMWFSDDYCAGVILFCVLRRAYVLPFFYLHTAILSLYYCKPCASIMFADLLAVSRLYCILIENDMRYLIIKITLHGLENGLRLSRSEVSASDWYSEKNRPYYVINCEITKQRIFIVLIFICFALSPTKFK